MSFDNSNNNPLARIITKDDKKIVEIISIMFSGKRRIDWDAVEQYLKDYIGPLSRFRTN